MNEISILRPAYRRETAAAFQLFPPLRSYSIPYLRESKGLK